MKKNRFIILFIFFNILFIILQIYKHTLFIRFTYQKQKHETEWADLVQKKQELTQKLYTLTDRTHIKKYAQKKLKMRPMKLNQVKKLDHHDWSV